MFSFPAIGYPLTTGMDLGSFLALGNQGWISNYGMQTQRNMFPVYTTPKDRFVAHNTESLSATNPLLYGIVNTDSIYDEASAQVRAKNAQQRGAQAAMIDLASINVKLSGQNLAALAAQLTSALETEGLTDSQKDRIKERLNEVKLLQEKLLNITKDLSNGGNLETNLDKLDKMLNKEIPALREKIGKLGEKLADEVKNNGSASSSDASDETDDTDDTDTETTPSDKETKPSKKYDKNGRPKNLEKPSEREIKDICLAFSDAVGYTWCGIPGTDNDAMKSVVDSLDANNVFEVMKNWKDNYCDGKVYNDDNFVDSFVYDANHAQKRDGGKKILKALVARAEANGLDVSEYEAKARKELNCTIIDNGVITENLMAIYDKIEAKEKENALKVSTEKEEVKETKVSKKEAEDKKKAEKIEKQKAQFIEDMKQCLERDDINALPAGVEVEKDDNGNFKGFKIRIKGKDYTGKDYLALVAALQKDKLTLPVPARKEQAA